MITPKCVIIAYTSVFSLAVFGQEQPVRDLTDAKLTPALLIEALHPPEDTIVHARGIAEAPPPSCRKISEQSRGLSEPPTAGVALHILFAFNSAELSPTAESDLDALGQALASPELSPYCFRVEGHTDDTGGEAYNLELSQRRGQAVQTYLTAKFGIDPDRLQVAGLGETQPLTSNTTEEGRQRNRRVQIRNLGGGGEAP